MEVVNRIGSGPSGDAPLAGSGRLSRPVGPNYKWLALTNTTMGVVLVTIDFTIMIIAMPDIFRGIRLLLLIIR